MSDYADWQVQAISDLENSDLSYKEIGDKYGRSRDTIIKLLKVSGVVRKFPTKKYGQRRTEDLRPLSPAHRALGVNITQLRDGGRYTDLAMKLNVSRHVLKNMEVGAHDFTLTQLVKLSEIMGRNIIEITSPHRVGTLQLSV